MDDFTTSALPLRNTYTESSQQQLTKRRRVQDDAANDLCAVGSFGTSGVVSEVLNNQTFTNIQYLHGWPNTNLATFPPQDERRTEYERTGFRIFDVGSQTPWCLETSYILSPTSVHAQAGITTPEFGSNQPFETSRTPGLVNEIPVDTVKPGRPSPKSPKSEEGPPQVCFGMINEMRAEFEVTPLPTETSVCQANWAGSGQLVAGETLEWGKLDAQSSDILEVLTNDVNLHTQILICSPMGVTRSQGQRYLDEPKVTTTVLVIIYGPIELFEDIGSFFQECGLYLQDPTGCDRNVPYRNPHRLQSHTMENLMTYDLCSHSGSVSATQSYDVDVLDAFVTPRDFSELETPSLLSIQLKPHQKQALYFMMQRELGWDLDDSDNEIWTEQATPLGSRYLNNVTCATQVSTPNPFRGGILADSMGLGKSCSMIALIANDFTSELLGMPASASRPSTGFLVPTTLLVVPLPLIETWEYQFKKHLRRSANFIIRRHHGPSRGLNILEASQYHVVITTYQTVEAEWRRSRSVAETPLLFSTQWRRIILDEAHYVRNRSTNLSKAVCELQAQCRWAVTGTPLQNRLSDLATICQFLKVYPYDDPKIFESDLIQVWRTESHSKAIWRLKRLLRAILLRRAKHIIQLPKRTDRVIALTFSHEEWNHYSVVQQRLMAGIDAVLDHQNGQMQGRYLGVLEQINELRLICNMGVHRKSASLKRPLDVTSDLWSGNSAQKAFEALVTAGNFICAMCYMDLNNVEMEDALGADLLTSQSRPQLYQCLRLVCGACFRQTTYISCGHNPPCSRAPVSHSMTSRRSGASSPSGSDSDLVDVPLPTKIKALVMDLKKVPPETKSVVFSYWTSTLDLIEKGLTQASISYTRYDGKTSARDRTNALHSFRTSTSISVILMTISCASVGLDITAASRAYIMEPQWNPTVEEQAFARVHRMGQTKEVTTVRFVMEGSFEQHVIKTQHKKRDLAELLLSSEKPSGLDKNLDRLRYFRSLLK
ncbi:hypothetical protein P154DRAFT_521342 [Amniculicola lignicola CBS 123094]|uniref:Uncharacterized protein n=1 Tax=Amniculicola lignicola CBS 123094 TaxID=1392246 RepID=A0A6A5WNV3_9PLEO|nr:hypothetical protein P154DRAFT_521342 [Amniculicola lignicola CBS 123094]